METVEHLEKETALASGKKNVIFVRLTKEHGDSKGRGIEGESLQSSFFNFLIF